MNFFVRAAVKSFTYVFKNLRFIYCIEYLHKVGGCFGAANRLICGGTSFSGHCLVRGMALGGVGAGRIMPSVTISRLGLGISQDGGKKT